MGKTDNTLQFLKNLAKTGQTEAKEIKLKKIAPDWWKTADLEDFNLDSDLVNRIYQSSEADLLKEREYYQKLVDLHKNENINNRATYINNKRLELIDKALEDKALIRSGNHPAQKFFNETGITPDEFAEALVASPQNTKIQKNFLEGNIEQNAKDIQNALLRDPETKQKLIKEIPNNNILNKKNIRNAAIAGLVAAGSSMTPEEAEAAGVKTISDILGIGLEEAAKVKALAKKKVPNDIFEENIRAIQSISGYKKDPSSLKSLGSGMDYKTFELPNDQVLKVPKTRTAPDEIYRTAPSLTEQAGIGPKTKLIEVGNNLYMTQDKVNPIDKIIASTRRPGKDPIIESLYKKQDELWKNIDINNPDQVRAMNENPEYLNLQAQLQNRENDLLKQQGLNLEDLQNEYNSLNPREKDFSSITYGSTPIETDPEGAIEDLVSIEARRKLGNVIRPQDTHSANVGLDKSGKRVIFDTSRFEGLRPENLSPEQKQKILENYIAKPEQKANLENLINSQQDFKKVAAIAPIAMGGEFGQSEQTPAAQPSVLDKAKEAGLRALVSGVQKVSNYYEGLSPETKVNLSATGDLLAAPNAALKGAVYAAQTDKPILEGIKTAWNNPEEAPTGEQIADATGLGDEYPLAKTAIATSAEFLDPQDIIGLGTLSKANKLKVLKGLK